MPGGFFGRAPSRFPYEQIAAQRRPQMAALLSFEHRNNVLLDGPSLLLQAVIIPGDKTREGQLVEAVALPWFEIIELVRAAPSRGVKTVNSIPAVTVGVAMCITDFDALNCEARSALRDRWPDRR